MPESSSAGGDYYSIGDRGSSIGAVDAGVTGDGAAAEELEDECDCGKPGGR